MKINFSKTWDEMTIPQRIEHLLADWKTCKDTNDALVLRVAATVALKLMTEEHRSACEDRDNLQRDVETLKAELVRNTDEFRETITELRQRVETLTAERDEARKLFCIYARCHPAGLNVVDQNGIVHLLTEISAEDHARARGWDCFKDEP